MLKIKDDLKASISTVHFVTAKFKLYYYIIWYKSVLYPSVIRCSIISSSRTIPELKLGKESFDIIRHERVAIYSFLQYFETVVIVALLGKFV